MQNLGKDPEALRWYVQAELVHGRTAMAAVAGILIPGVRGAGGAVVAACLCVVSGQDVWALRACLCHPEAVAHSALASITQQDGLN